MMASSCSGWILSLTVLRKNSAVAVLTILVSLLFTAVAVLGVIMLKRVSVSPGWAQGRLLACPDSRSLAEPAAQWSLLQLGRSCCSPVPVEQLWAAVWATSYV